MALALGVNGLKQAETVRNVCHVAAENGVTADDMLKPDYWVHVSRKMRIGDKIEILAADASWYAEARVVDVDRQGKVGASVAFTLSPVELKREELQRVLDYEARVFGSGWQVFKIGDPQPVKRDLPDRVSAEKWIASQRQAMAA